MKDKCKGVGI